MTRAWKQLVLYSTGLAAVLVICLVALGLLVVVGTTVVISKILVFIR